MLLERVNIVRQCVEAVVVCSAKSYGNCALHTPREITFLQNKTSSCDKVLIRNQDFKLNNKPLNHSAATEIKLQKKAICYGFQATATLYKVKSAHYLAVIIENLYAR